MTAGSTWLPSTDSHHARRPCCWATATARSSTPASSPRPSMPTPLVADVNGDGTDDVLVVDAAGDILYRQGIPGQPGTFDPPVTINPGRSGPASRYLARHRLGPQDRLRARCSPASTPTTTRSRSTPGATGISSGSDRSPPDRSRRRSSRPTSTATAGTTWSSAMPATARSRFSSATDQFTVPSIPQFDHPDFLPPVTLPVGLGVSDVQAVDTTGSGTLDLVVTNKLTGQVSILRNLGDGDLRAARALSRRDRLVRRSTPAARPRSPAWKRRRAWPPDRSRRAVRPTW